MTITELARQSIAHYLGTGKIMSVPAELPPQLRKRAAAFVSLHQANGDLRGCIGTIEPVRPNLAAEIITNAVLAATDDPRFAPLTAGELPSLQLGVDVLSPARRVTDPGRLDPKTDGLIVTAGRRQGVLLPGLEGVDTVDQQIAICRDKAGIDATEQVTLATFTVQRFEE